MHPPCDAKALLPALRYFSLPSVEIRNGIFVYQQSDRKRVER